jgi:hypothetical protein
MNANHVSGLREKSRIYDMSTRMKKIQDTTNPLIKRKCMTKVTMMSKLFYLACAGLALGLNHRVSAQDDHWNGTNTPSGILWNNPANWSEGVVPPNDATANPPFLCGNTNGTGGAPVYFAGNVWLDPANGDSVIEIPPGDIELPGIPQCNEGDTYAYNTIFGPEFGLTLNVYGSLSWAWTMAPYGPNPAARSIINMYSNSTMSTTGASLNLGDGWWPVATGCYVTMNMYGNSSYSSLGGAGWWWGGHLNVYDNASFLVNGYVNMGDVSNPNWEQSDGTRSLVIGGGTVTLPEGFNVSQLGAAPNWITRGLLRAYGKGEDTNDLIISDNGTNTIVTVVPLGGALKQVYFQPVLKATVPVGTFQQLVLVGDYPSVTGVYLSSVEPGLSPSSFPQPVYSSSNPNVVAVDVNGVATAISPGSATVSASVGAFTTTNTVTITVANHTTLSHRYSFSETSGTSTADSVGGVTYAGTLQGGATLGGGQVTLDGATGYVQLPAGILSGMDEVTIEAWASFGTQLNYASLCSFGYSDQTGDGNNGLGADYIAVQLDHGSPGNTFLEYGPGIPGFTGEQDAVANMGLDGMTNVHVVAVYHPYAGYQSLYINGALVGTQTMFNTMSDPVAFAGPTYNSGSILAYMLGPQSVFDGALTPDQNNLIGWDTYQGATFGPPAAGGTGDPTLNGSVDEFRIYNGPLTAAQINADFALGPNQFIGTNTAVTLSATLPSSTNILVSWPTNAAYVNLVSSTVLGSSAAWTPVRNGTLTIVGTNYQATVPIASSVQFFGLQN